VLRTKSGHRPTVQSLAQHFVLGLFAGLLIKELGVFELGGITAVLLVVFVCGLVGLGMDSVGLGRWLAPFDLVLLGVLLVIATTPAIVAPARRWVRNDPLPRTPVDAVVVLTGGLTADSSLGTAGTERLLSGLDLVRAGVAPRIVTTRVRGIFHGRVINTDAGQRRLVHLAGLDSVWTVVDSVPSTRGEALRTAQLLFPSGKRTVAVVTSPMHTRRACATFEGVGFKVTCVAAKGLQFSIVNSMSQEDRLDAFREYVYEHVGMLKYRMKGWLPKAAASS
jgi:uncharacterized SAM-binding protein YcdF (DUF218 family)